MDLAKNAAVVRGLFVGQTKEIKDRRGTWASSIHREPVSGPIQVVMTGLAGDKVTQPMHGGPSQALCIHLTDHYIFWKTHYNLELRAGGVGENVTLEGITEDEVCAGDIVRLGTSLVQVSGPRVPCGNQARWIGRKDWVNLTLKENRTGFYLRVLEEGVLQVGDSWKLQERLNPEGSIPAINRCMYLEFDAHYAQRLTEMLGLAQWWKDRIRKKAEEVAQHQTLEKKAG
jgi:MOSC domain-containing protein YiiM